MSDEHGHDDHGHHGTIAPFVFSIGAAIMFIGLVMATAGGENQTGDSGYWFVFLFRTCRTDDWIFHVGTGLLGPRFRRR